MLRTSQYDYEGWRIRVAFIDGIAARETYQKIQAAPGSTLIKDFELSTILKAEQGDGTWKERPSQTKLWPNPIAGFLQEKFQNGLGVKVWIRTDGALAFGHPDSVLPVRLETVAAAQADARTKQQNEEKQRVAVPQF